ncbi:MAG: glucosyltransferase domain-containing protein [Lachnospiraceae bacterium]|nr:glucosyltransferase domain-containing protein [Lachnospiraceae bacterium]
MMKKLKNDKILIYSLKVVLLVLLVLLTYVILSWGYSGKVYGLSSITFSIDDYDKIKISDYYEKAHDLYINDDGSVTSMTSDPWFYEMEVNGKQFAIIYVNRIMDSTYNGYTVSQFYLKKSGESYLDSEPIEYRLYEGFNLINFETDDYDFIRFDITTSRKCTIDLESFSLADKFVFPKSMWLILGVLTVIYVLLLFFYNRCRYVAGKFFVVGTTKKEFKGRGIFNRSKKYWIFVILAVLLGYGFTLTNVSVGVDDLQYDATYMVPPYRAIQQGRWVMNFLVNIFDTYSFLQYWRGLLGIIVAIAALTIWCHLFEKCSNGRFSDRASIIFTMLSITCPYVAYVYVFNMCTFEYGLKYLITGIVMLLFYDSMFEKSLKKRIVQNITILVILLLVGGETIYINLFVALCEIGILIFVFNNEDKKLNLKKCVIHGMRLLALSLANLVLFKIIAKIYMRLYNVSSDGYTSNYLRYDSELSIGENASEFMERLLSKFHRYLHGDLAGLLLLISIAVILIIGVIYSIKKKNGLIILCAVFITILPFGLMIVTGNVNVPKRTLTVYSLVYAFVFALLAILCENIRLKKYKGNLSIVIACIAVYITIFQTKDLNEVFVKDYNRYQTDIKIMNDIQSELIKIEGYNKKSVLFIGYPSTTMFNADDVIGASIFMWDRKENITAELNSVRIKAFFKYHGYYLDIVSEYDYEQIASEIEDAPIYPYEGYVFEAEDYIIINLGKNTNLYKELNNGN